MVPLSPSPFGMHFLKAKRYLLESVVGCQRRAPSRSPSGKRAVGLCERAGELPAAAGRLTFLGVAASRSLGPVWSARFGLCLFWGMHVWKLEAWCIDENQKDRRVTDCMFDPPSLCLWRCSAFVWPTRLWMVESMQIANVANLQYRNDWFDSFDFLIL